LSNAAKNFEVLATSLSILIILIVQQNYFSGLYPATILDFSAKLFFPCNNIFLNNACYLTLN